MTRKEIIKMLDVSPSYEYNYYSSYERLKFCIETVSETTLIDNWFTGVINSLYYRPNHTVLVLEGYSSGCSMFLEELFPQKEMFTVCFSKSCGDEIYNKLVINTGFFKNTLGMASEDNFTVKNGNPYPYAEKRLASYCTTESNWPYPPRKNFFVIKISDIDWMAYRSINKLDLWIDIFRRFKS